MYSDIFCKVYNEFGWNYYPEIFGRQLLEYLRRTNFRPRNAMDLGCGTGVLCRILREAGIEAAGMDYSPGMIDIAREASPEIPYCVADMVTFRPEIQYDLVTCTGDALNHIGSLTHVARIFRNVYDYTAPGGYFIFDILNENEVSDSEPFEMDFTDTTRVWFQMTRPGENQVNLCIRVYEQGELELEENIRETVHDRDTICRMLQEAGFRLLLCDDRLLEDDNHGTTWFVAAQKPLREQQGETV